jgi:hypothetical protein
MPANIITVPTGSIPSSYTSTASTPVPTIPIPTVPSITIAISVSAMLPNVVSRPGTPPSSPQSSTTDTSKIISMVTTNKYTNPNLLNLAKAIQNTSTISATSSMSPTDDDIC